MIKPDKKMLISPLWLQAALLTFLFGFTVLGYLAAKMYTESPPIPRQVVTADGAIIYTGEDIMAGQHLFQKFGLMQFGTLFGHGAYLGPDFTAQYLHHSAEMMSTYYQEQGMTDVASAARVKQELKKNRYDPRSGTLIYSPGQAEAFKRMSAFYTDWFGPAALQEGLRRPYLEDPAAIRNITAYFSWAAWASAARRPGTAIRTPTTGLPNRWRPTAPRRKPSSGAP